ESDRDNETPGIKIAPMKQFPHHSLPHSISCIIPLFQAIANSIIGDHRPLCGSAQRMKRNFPEPARSDGAEFDRIAGHCERHHFAELAAKGVAESVVTVGVEGGARHPAEMGQGLDRDGGTARAGVIATDTLQLRKYHQDVPQQPAIDTSRLAVARAAASS